MVTIRTSLTNEGRLGFFHNLGTMSFHGFGTYIHFVGDLLVLLARQNAIEDLTFARGQSIDALADIAAIAFDLPVAGIVLDTFLNAVNEFLVGERFL